MTGKENGAQTANLNAAADPLGTDLFNTTDYSNVLHDPAYWASVCADLGIAAAPEVETTTVCASCGGEDLGDLDEGYGYLVFCRSCGEYGSAADVLVTMEMSHVRN